jgi:hypothetical protein
MKKNVFLMGFVMVGLLAFMVGCDSGSSTASSDSGKLEPPSAFMGKRVIVSGMMDDVESTFLRKMDMDQNAMNVALNEFSLQKFIESPVFEQHNVKFKGWEKLPSGWKIVYEHVEQQKDGHMLFEAGYDGEVNIAELGVAGELRKKLTIAETYAQVFDTYLQGKGIQRKAR